MDYLRVIDLMYRTAAKRGLSGALADQWIDGLPHEERQIASALLRIMDDQGTSGEAQEPAISLQPGQYPRERGWSLV